MAQYENEILILKDMIEQSVSRKIQTPADFQFLTGVIQERCKETLGVTTLKRLWGYIEGYDTTRVSTLSILARAVGFRDWDDFLANYQQDGESSQWVFGYIVGPSMKMLRRSRSCGTKEVITNVYPQKGLSLWHRSP